MARQNSIGITFGAIVVTAAVFSTIYDARAQDDQTGNYNAAPAYSTHTVADNRLHSEMYAISRWLENYCTMNFKFPWQQNDIAYARSQIVDLAPVNPYTSSIEYVGGSALSSMANSGLPGAAVSEADRERIQLKLDYEVSPYTIKQWVREPPDDWQAAPGTITAISNNKNMFVVWGAGYDGRPIRDELSHRPVLVVGRWTSGSQDQDTSTDASTDADSSD